MGLVALDGCVSSIVCCVTIGHGICVVIVWTVPSEHETPDFRAFMLDAFEESSDCRVGFLGVFPTRLVWTGKTTGTLVLSVIQKRLHSTRSSHHTESNVAIVVCFFTCVARPSLFVERCRLELILVIVGVILAAAVRVKGI
jgi:hypothetical protein